MASWTKTVLDRIGLMAWDADTTLKTAYTGYQPSIDKSVRPCIIVSEDGESYPVYASENEQPEMRVVIDYIGPFFTADCQEEYEEIARQTADNLIEYFMRRPQLPFSNVRNHAQLTAKGNLVSVKWARISDRTKTTLVTRFGLEQAFWGVTLNMTVVRAWDYEEVIAYADDDPIAL